MKVNVFESNETFQSDTTFVPIVYMCVLLNELNEF